MKAVWWAGMEEVFHCDWGANWYDIRGSADQFSGW
jgi:hypothetical protein